MDRDTPAGRRRPLDETQRMAELRRRRQLQRRRRLRRRRLYSLVLIAGGILTFVALTSGSGARHPLVRSASVGGIAAGASRTGHQQRRALAPVNPFRSPALRAYLRGRAGNITAAVYDVKTGRSYYYRPGVEEQTASIVKVQILATLLHEEQDEHESPAEQENEVAQGMIEASDNDDATALWDNEGGAPAVQEFDDSIGMRQTTADVAWGLTTTTPRDQLDLLRHVLLPNPVLDRASRAYAYGLMRNVIPFDYWGVSGGVGPHARVALKNGWLPLPTGWQVNSIGLVTGSGRDYLLAVMTNEESTEAYGIATIDAISAAAWRASA